MEGLDGPPMTCEEHEELVLRLRDWRARLSVELPKIEVRFEDVSVETEVYVRRRVLPTLSNTIINTAQFVGKVTHNGAKMDRGSSQRMCAFVGQRDVHHAEMTVKETIEFARRMLNAGNNSGDLLITITGLDECADTRIGDEMRRGISGGQKKRVTIGEMLAAPAQCFFMDDISTGLDSLTAFQILKYLQQLTHVLDLTMVVSLLQPTQEAFNLFDDIIFLCEGRIAYQGPRQHVLEFFESMGFKCPDRKNIADFLLEVTSKMDQEQYWVNNRSTYQYMPVQKFSDSFGSSHHGRLLQKDLHMQHSSQKSDQMIGTKERSSIPKWDVFKMSMALFRFIAIIGRTQVMANTIGTASLTAIFILGGFVISKDSIQSWLIWGYWFSPVTYGQNAVAINEFLDERWSMNSEDGESTNDTVGKTILKLRGMLTESHWYWYSVAILLIFAVVFNIFSIFALEYLKGAGKTTLLDVLAGRKTVGHIEGSINISGYPKKQETFARVSGYCEQADNHSPCLTVFESLWYSAWLRLPSQVDGHTISIFINEVMELVELKSLKDAMVGLPGTNGLTAEQRKRLTIAVELVSSPSIIFMDEPTTGLDARAAAIVMRTVRKTADTGRTIVCTIHQPSTEMFEAFDEAIPGVPQIRDDQNPATWMLDVTSPAMEYKLGIDYGIIFSKSSLYIRTEQDIFNIQGAIYGSALFIGFANASILQPVVEMERTTFYRERASGMYSSMTYAIAQVAIEIPYTIVQVLIFSIIVYPMMGFQFVVAKFFWFMFFMLLSYIYYALFGMMTVAITPNQEIAAALSFFLFVLWNIFSGFFIPRKMMPSWWRWYYWVDPAAWTIYGLMVSQLGDNVDLLQVAGRSDETVKEFLKEYFGLQDKYLSLIVSLHVAVIVLFLFIFGFSIKHLNFQKR
ncbi:Plant PDR ABC transporter associated [Musa troglodytarum]|uniref:Plant PDR ABC transporter associated n=1 Tax=Musa troglodytarum TaxID=320322 RepID=A0A9E7J9K0_9LILI|nr:Plant PDR ABC transporter associated [Musa troglodytarum]